MTHTLRQGNPWQATQARRRCRARRRRTVSTGQAVQLRLSTPQVAGGTSCQVVGTCTRESVMGFRTCV